MKDYKYWKKHFDAIIAGNPWDEKKDHFYQPINYIMNLPGKRLRPAFVMMMANLFKEDVTQLSNQALAFEVFHNFSLVHDDIMDHADLRRGELTVHKKFGADTAILSGDAMMILSTELLLSGLSSELAVKIMPIFNKSALDVCYGQQQDMYFEEAERVTLAEYEEMIEGKTAALVRACFEIGAVLGGANSEDQQLACDYGKYLGLAFQVKDDIIDVFSDTQTSGKKQGGDIVENKKTYLSISLADKMGWNEFNALLQETNTWSEADKIAHITELYHKYKVKEVVESLFIDYHKKAMDSLNKISVPQERKEVLIRLSDLLLNRSY